MVRQKVSNETREKFIHLIETYGENYELEVFDICSDKGIDLDGSTIDKITIEGTTIVFYYNENIGDFDTIDAFDEDCLIDFADELSKYIEDYFNKDFARNTLVWVLNRIFEMDDSERVADVLIDDVFQDVIETADKCFNSGDVEIALARVLKKHLGIED